MTMLTGIRAFEARWQSIKGSRSARDSRLLMQAMGRLVDNYATHEEISADLPASLRGVFNRLVDAYLNGFWLDESEGGLPQNSASVLSPAMLAAQQLRQRRRSQVIPQPTAASEAATYVIRDRSAIA